MRLLEKPYFKWLRHCAADPLWWLFLAGPVGWLVLRAVGLGGGVSRKLESGALLIPMALAIIAEAARGTTIGDRKRLKAEARAGWAAVGIVELAIFVDLMLL
ncbi:hypothetical protein [Paratractidigestivibacter sp.]|uniref:hypothetical protein n=1 Tax=Paratractidigestivibacter sp. TaxID=2847316 RepID=UPI002ABE028B|nr:hypothetical protein [Paratractidigestivibacter sp.]